MKNKYGDISNVLEELVDKIKDKLTEPESSIEDKWDFIQKSVNLFKCFKIYPLPEPVCSTKGVTYKNEFSKLEFEDLKRIIGISDTISTPR